MKNSVEMFENKLVNSLRKQSKWGRKYESSQVQHSHKRNFQEARQRP